MAAGVSIRHVNLGQCHEFPDLTPIPPRLWKSFNIEIFDDMEADGDWAVSDSIAVHGVWEPVETAVLSSAFAGGGAYGFIDIGCHVGWYTAIARAWGLPVLAIDAVAECIDMLDRRGDSEIHASQLWVDAEFPERAITPPPGIPQILKVDIEGAEIHVIQWARELFLSRTITHALIEMSPVFNTTYPNIANVLIAAGYECWVLPDKRTPPPVMYDTRRWLTEDCMSLHDVSGPFRTKWINAQHQFNAVFCLPEATWG